MSTEPTHTDETAAEILVASDRTRWTVHVIGPDDVHYFADAAGVEQFVAGSLFGLAQVFPRDSELYPMIRLVISPPTAVLDPGASS